MNKERKHPPRQRTVEVVHSSHQPTRAELRRSSRRHHVRRNDVRDLAARADPLHREAEVARPLVGFRYSRI